MLLTSEVSLQKVNNRWKIPNHRNWIRSPTCQKEPLSLLEYIIINLKMLQTNLALCAKKEEEEKNMLLINTWLRLNTNLCEQHVHSCLYCLTCQCMLNWRIVIGRQMMTLHNEYIPQKGMFIKNNLSGININVYYLKKKKNTQKCATVEIESECIPNVNDNYTTKTHTGIAGSVKPSNYTLRWLDHRKRRTTGRHL